MNSAIVVGGGISGIAAASCLVERGFSTRVLESEMTLGGRIGTRRSDGLEIDLGGRNFSIHDRHLVQLLASFGITELSDYRINSVSVGTRRPFDMRSGGSLATRIGRFFKNATCAGPLELMRLQKVVGGARKDATGSVVGGPYWIRIAEQTADPSAASFFGAAVADHVLRPWTLRMMAAEPEEVYLGNLGPLLGRTPGPLKRVGGGMGSLLQAATQRLDVRLGHVVRSVIVNGGRVTGVEGTTADGATFREAADLIVLTTPAPIAADMLASVPALAQTLREIIYRPVATIVADYADVTFPGGASGLFLPRGHAASHIAKYDDTNRVRFSYAGVAARRAMSAMSQASLDELLDLGETAFARFGGRLGRRASFVGNVWRPGLCGQTWMHHQTVRMLVEQSSKVGGLVLTGDYFRGNSLEACAGAARENVERVLERPPSALPPPSAGSWRPRSVPAPLESRPS